MDKTGIYTIIVISLVIVAVIAYFVGSMKVPEVKTVEKYIPGKEVVKYTPGQEKIITRVERYPVYIQVKPETKDSGLTSQFDTTVVVKDGYVQVRGTTRPAVETIDLEVIPILNIREIYRVDTLDRLRVDTLLVEKTIKIDPPFYETWWFGSLITGAVGVAAIILSK